MVIDLDSGVPGKTVLVRADMDALPYADENNPEEFVAIHACGHDAHSAVLMSAAEGIRENLKKGKVRLVFQPAEESLEGALAMIKDNVLDGVDIAVGAHIRPVQDIPFGTFCTSVNHVACATAIVTITGKQAHAARPHLGVNPIEASSQYIAAIGLIKVNPNKSWSVKPTQINSEKGATNSIPTFVKIAFDLRAEDNESLDFIINRMKTAAASLKGSFDAEATVEITQFCPASEYDAELIKQLRETIVDLYGEESVAKDCGGGGEDFHFFKHTKPEIKTVYFGIGSGAEPGLHNRNMNFDDSVLPNAANLMAEYVTRLANQ